MKMVQQEVTATIENQRPLALFLMSNYLESYMICLLRNGTDFVAPEFVDSYSPPHGISPPRLSPIYISVGLQHWDHVTCR